MLLKKVVGIELGWCLLKILFNYLNGKQQFVHIISIRNKSILVRKIVYGPDKIDVVKITEIKSQSSVATVIAELKKDWLHYMFGPDNTCSAISRKMASKRLEANRTQVLKELDPRWFSHQCSGLHGLELIPLKV